jgi:hypothetical protein
MRILVFPREGLREPPIPKTGDDAYRRKRFEWRRNEVDVFFSRLATALSLGDEARLLAERKLQKLPAVGMIVIDDSIVSLERLRSLNWLLAFEERPLPRPMRAEPLSGAGTAMAWHLATINKPSTLDGSPVSIGVIDSGCNPMYSDLSGFAPTFRRYDDPTGDMLAEAPSDGSVAHHGSKVCSLMAGSTNGVAPKALYLVAAVVAPDYATTQIGMVKAFEWLFTQATGAHPDRGFGCDIITTSLHTGGYQEAPAAEIQPLLDAAEGWDTLVVAAVGNGGVGNYQPPGSGSTVVAVGAVDVHRDVGYLSADGKPTALIDKPDLLAPGMMIEWPTPYGIDYGEGTSFAAPIVAAAAALILEQRPVLRSNVVNFRNTVLSFVSNSSAQGTIRGGRGICDLHGL